MNPPPFRTTLPCSFFCILYLSQQFCFQLPRHLRNHFRLLSIIPPSKASVKSEAIYLSLFHSSGPRLLSFSYSLLQLANHLHYRISSHPPFLTLLSNCSFQSTNLIMCCLPSTPTSLPTSQGLCLTVKMMANEVLHDTNIAHFLLAWPLSHKHPIISLNWLPYHSSMTLQCFLICPEYFSHPHPSPGLLPLLCRVS